MAATAKAKSGFTIKAHRGDMKTLLAFNLPKAKTKNLAGFTIFCEPQGQAGYYLLNNLRFEKPGDHAQDATKPANASINAPFHKFRWLHVPGSSHQGLKPATGPYTYTVTPRYFEDGSLQPIDPDLGLSVTVDVGPFVTKALSLGFTRGYTQSQAFVHHFGLKASIKPAKSKDLIFDTTQVSGKNAQGQSYTFADEYEWLGFTARARIFEILDEVRANKSLRLDVFAYDLNEPDFMKALLELAKQGRVRVILDDATLHHDAQGSKPEDKFEALFNAAAKKPAELLRGKFGRFAHDKVLIVSNAKGAKKVLTGSTNFSVTGLYVNSNHVLVFDDPLVAAKYAEVFEESWNGKVSKSFAASPLAAQAWPFKNGKTPSTTITFSPHQAPEAAKVLANVVARIAAEEKTSRGSVLFAVMELGSGTGPVFPALEKLHQNLNIFSFGISDNPSGIYLYPVGRSSGVLVTGKPGKRMLPPPFDQVPDVGLGHQVHHKFVVCGFNGKDPTVFCGSSNLAQGGEANNGDNLIEIHDADVATAFAIEALGLVDHFNFLNNVAPAGKGKKPAKPEALKLEAAVQAEWFLSTNDKWKEPYYDTGDLHYVDRELFA